MSRVERTVNGKQESVRPAFNHRRNGDTWTAEEAMSEMLESARNVLEEIRDKQMLQCDVRTDIKKMRIAIEKIAKNTSRPRRTRKVTA